jgi:hypothetical protein
VAGFVLGLDISILIYYNLIMAKKRRTKEDVVLEQAIMNTDLWYTWPGPLTQPAPEKSKIKTQVEIKC